MTVTSTDAAGATAQGSTPLVIVSADTHIGPRLVEDLRPYCPKHLLDEFDAYAGDLRAKREAAAANKEKVSFGGTKPGPDWGVRFANLQTEGPYDRHARLRDLDNDGVAAEVMVHDSQNGEPIPFQSDTLLTRGTGVEQDFELLTAGRHIYNAWLADVRGQRQADWLVGLQLQLGRFRFRGTVRGAGVVNNDQADFRVQYDLWK